jgi:hypothetical protein
MSCSELAFQCGSAKSITPSSYSASMDNPTVRDYRRTPLGYLGNKSWSNLLASIVDKLTLYIAKQILQLLNSDLKVTTGPSSQKGFRRDSRVGCYCFAACLTVIITEKRNMQTLWHISELSISLAIWRRVCPTNRFWANSWHSALEPSRSTFVLFKFPFNMPHVRTSRVE